MVRFPSTIPINAPAAFLLALFVACVPARAADTCLSLPQARAAYPNKYLSYHIDGGRRCWSAQSPRQRTARHRSPSQTPPMPVAPRSTIFGQRSLPRSPATSARRYLRQRRRHVGRCCSTLTNSPAARWPTVAGRRSMSRHLPTDGLRCRQIGLRR